MDHPDPRSMGYRTSAYGSPGAYETSYEDDDSFDEYDNYSEQDNYNRYDEGYRPDPRSDQPERRGWRRFFGRK
jgi:hypothetical protein